jgi:hypothetical protein
MLLVYRLSDQSVSLNAESALITVAHPFRAALINLIFRSRYPTYVWKSDKGKRKATAFIQLHLAPDSPNAHILNVGASAAGKAVAEIDEDVWLPLLDQLVAVIGRRGIHSLMAQVSESGAELPVLRRAGFAVYTRQDIWVANLINNKHKAAILQPRRAIDDWEVQILYANIVPRLIQLVEPMPPLNYGKSWVLREDAELVSFVHLNHGPLASWMRLFIHPNASVPPEEIIRAAHQMKPAKVSHPMYCCVGRYQSWLQHALQEMGFRFWGSQAVMVKQTVQHRQRPLPTSASGLETRVAPGSPLTQRLSDGSNGSADSYGTGAKILQSPASQEGGGLPYRQCII